MKFLIEYLNSNTGNKESMKIEADNYDEALGKWEEETEWQFQFPKISEYKPLSIMPKPVEELTEKQKLQRKINWLRSAERDAYNDENGKLLRELFEERIKLEDDLSKL